MRMIKDDVNTCETVDLAGFRRHIDQTVVELLGFMAGNEYTDTYDLSIEWNGKRVRLRMNADLYDRLELLIDETIEEEETK